MKRVQKRTAKKLWEQGIEVYMMPCKCNLGGFWIMPCPMPNINSFDETDKGICERIGITLFQKVVNSFECYNCNNEMGLYTHFYIDD